MAAKSEETRPPQHEATPGPGDGLVSERELWERFAEHRDQATREELVRRYLPFAKNLALRYRGASESFDDLLQVASLGLVNAIDRFDPSRGTPFAAFASPTILGELKRHFRDRVWTVRVPRGLHDRMAEVDKAISALTVELQRSPSVGEIAAKLEIDPNDVLEVLEANHNRRPLSLDRPVGGDEEESPASEWVGDEDEGFELVEDKLALEGALPHLDERERLVLQLRFVEDMTQSQIAERIGHSQMHVSRILRRTLERIRAEVAEQGDGAKLGGTRRRARRCRRRGTRRRRPARPGPRRPGPPASRRRPAARGWPAAARAPPPLIGPTRSSRPSSRSAMLSETWPSSKPRGALAEIASLSSIVSERRSTVISRRAAKAPRARLRIGATRSGWPTRIAAASSTAADPAGAGCRSGAPSMACSGRCMRISVPRSTPPLISKLLERAAIRVRPIRRLGRSMSGRGRIPIPKSRTTTVRPSSSWVASTSSRPGSSAG